MAAASARRRRWRDVGSDASRRRGVREHGPLCAGGRAAPQRQELPPRVLLGAPDPHALLVRAVGGFLDLASAPLGRDTSEWWANCVALIECAPRLAAPSPDALAQAKRLAGHWKEMVVAGPAGAGGRDIGGMAGWGLLTFIASYNIVPEFDADEIVRLFDNIAPQVKDNCVELCKRLGLIGKMTGTCSSTSTLNDEFTCLISKALCAQMNVRSPVRCSLYTGSLLVIQKSECSESHRLHFRWMPTNALKHCLPANHT